jgi:hypothetical protein
VRGCVWSACDRQRVDETAKIDGVEPDGRPLRLDLLSAGRSGGDLRGFYLEDAELRLAGKGVPVVAQRPLGMSRAGLARGDQLAGELDEVRRQRQGQLGGRVQLIGSRRTIFEKKDVFCE